jgi:DNA polymerase III epsilon subunit-like protein
MIRPPDFDDEDYFQKHKGTIEWHAKTLKCKVEDILAKWDKAPPEKDVFNNFKEYLLRYHTRTTRKNKFSAPLKAGYNIVKFDNIIIQRLAEKYNALDSEGVCSLFHPRDQIDALFLSFMWFENLEEPKKYNMDELRSYLGMSGETAHDALGDVRDTANLIIRMMRLHRRTANNVKFKGSFKND